MEHCHEEPAVENRLRGNSSDDIFQPTTEQSGGNDEPPQLRETSTDFKETQQTGGNDNPPYEIVRTGQRTFARTAATETTYRVRFHNQWQGERIRELRGQLHDMFERVIEHGRVGLNDNDLIRIVIRANSLNNAIVVPLQAADEMSADKIMDKVETVLQSEENLAVDNTFQGYANEVGEAFRSQVHVKFVYLSYAVASSYVCADAAHKGYEASRIQNVDKKTKHDQISWAVTDTFIWQGLASVVIPGFTINRICSFSAYCLRKSKLPMPAQKWATTFLGLACIPFIIRPIDTLVDLVMEGTFRKWYKITPIMEQVVTHSRSVKDSLDS